MSWRRRLRRVVRVNVGWMRLRWEHARRCDGAWIEGDRKGRRACSGCGVWFWNLGRVRFWLGDPEATPRWLQAGEVGLVTILWIVLLVLLIVFLWNRI